MIKTILLACFLAVFTFIAIPTAQACGGANCSECAEAKAHYDKKAKKAPCADCVKAKKHYKMTGEKKPCAKCAEAKAHYKAKKSMKTQTSDVNTAIRKEKGSLTFQSGSSVNTGISSPYND